MGKVEKGGLQAFFSLPQCLKKLGVSGLLKVRIVHQDYLSTYINSDNLGEVIEDTKAEPVIDKPMRKADSLDDLLDTALESSVKPVQSKPTPIVSTEPPPLFDESEDEDAETVEKNRTK